MAKRPNIIILNPDQMRADTLAHLGNPASHTPNLDKLAGEGVSFSSAFCQNPVCTPSRCSFMSGLYPHVSGHRTMTHMQHPWEPVLLKELKDSGYNVWMNQRNDLLPAQLPDYEKAYCTTYFRLTEKPFTPPESNWRGEKGGDNYYSFFRGLIPEGKDVDEVWTDAVVSYIENYDSDKPFCIFLPWMNPHPVYQVSEPYFSMIDRSKLPPRINLGGNYEGKPRFEKELARLQGLSGWSEERFDELRAVYLGMCAKVDAMTGRILDALKEKGFYDDSAVFFFSDHGDYTGDYGLVEKAQNCFEDCLVNVPFIVKLPRAMQVRKGVLDELTELVDFYATAHEVAGLDDLHTQFGISLVPYLEGKSSTLRCDVLSEGGFCRGENHCKETGGPKVPVEESLYYPRQYLQSSDEMYNGKAVMLRSRSYKYIKRLYERDELYDLAADPEERVNLSGDERYREVEQEMKERLLYRLIESGDTVPYQKDMRMEKQFSSMMMH